MNCHLNIWKETLIFFNDEKRFQKSAGIKGYLLAQKDTQLFYKNIIYFAPLTILSYIFVSLKRQVVLQMFLVHVYLLAKYSIDAIATMSF